MTRCRRAWLILFALLVGAAGCATHKTYAPAVPPVQPRQGMLVGARIAVGIYDARPVPMESNLISEAILGSLRLAYPAVEWVVVPLERVHSDAAPGMITIRVAIAAHVADFGRKITPAVGLVGGAFVLGVVPEGQWNGLSGFVVSVIDKRAGDQAPKVQSLSKLISKPNTWGYRTAKSALDEAFRANVQEFLLYLDGALGR